MIANRTSRRLALACAGCLPALAAQAQSSVTIYGNLDATVTYKRSGQGTTLPGGGAPSGPSKNLFSVDSGIGPGSRLGFRGREDLGDGLAAIFTLEMGIAVDTGALQQGGLAFGRQIFFGLKGNSWSLTAGHQYSPMAIALGTADVTAGAFWATGSGETGHGLYEGLGSTPGDGTFNSAARVDNSLVGTLNAGPFSARLMLAAGNENSQGTGRLANPALFYVEGPLTLIASYLYMRTPASFLLANAKPQKMSEWMIGGGYDFGVVRFAAGLFEFSGPRDRAGLSVVLTPGATGASPFAYSWDKTRSFWLSAALPVGNGRFMASATRVVYDYASGGRGHSKVLGLTYQHYLSKRTSVYLTGGKVANDAMADTAMYAAVPALVPNGFGSDPQALSIGVQHAF